MCVNCDVYGDGLPDFDEISRALNVLLNGGPAPKTPEEQRQEANALIRKNRERVVSSVSIDDNVTVHFLSGSEDYRDSVVKTVTDMQKNYTAPGKVDVFFPGIVDDEPVIVAGAVGTTQGATSRVKNFEIDPDSSDRMMILTEHAYRLRKSGDNWHMPVYENDKVDELEYVIVHEWGHVVDNRPITESYFDSLVDRMQSEGIIDEFGALMPRFGRSLSRYGMDGEAEGYAECFAEWAVSNGQTDNFAANWYAREYNWPTQVAPIRFTPRRRSDPSPHYYTF